MACRRFALLAILLSAASCSKPPDSPQPTADSRPAAADDRVKALADRYLEGYFERNPDAATFFSIPGHRHDRLLDNSLAALKVWEAKEDAWLAQATAIDPETIAQPSLRGTYAIVREALEGSIGARVCRGELWNVSQTAGWQVNLGYLVTIQPVGTGLFYISAYRAETKSRSSSESTAFHETIPGHHLQSAIALERKENHPLGRYLYNSGFSEGWGLYSERLADEMKLFSSDVDRLGMLSSQAFRAARLVVDTGMHTMGWTRQQAIDYMLAHTTESAADMASEIDRYIIWPGQATSYMLGMIEIRKAREDAEQQMGSRFDLKAFHDRVLEDGSVPLTFLTGKIRRWAAGS